MKVTVKITVPDDENCGKCFHYDEYSEELPQCDVFDAYITNCVPCPDCLLARLDVKKRMKDEQLRKS